MTHGQPLTVPELDREVMQNISSASRADLWLLYHLKYLVLDS